SIKYASSNQRHLDLALDVMAPPAGLSDIRPCKNCDNKMPTRRQALKSLLAAGAGALATGLYTWRVEPHWLEFTDATLPIRELPPELEGRTLVQLSDLHVGREVDDDYIIHSFGLTQRLAPDFVVCTGDWMTYRSPDQFVQLRRVLEHLPHGGLGTVGILGNHEYAIGWHRVDVADRVTTIARDSGVMMLRNEAVRMSGLQFIGLDDLWSPRFDPMGILADRGQVGPTIVLCHNPDAADRPVWN